VSNLLPIYSALTGRAIAELETACQGKGYGDLKKDLAEALVEFITPFQNEVTSYLFDISELDRLLARGRRWPRCMTGSASSPLEGRR
jgi:tryptophanyl-tRNA synthetase